MTKSLRSAGAFALMLAAPVVVSLQGCTDLSETPSSALTPENFPRNAEEVLGALAGVYAQLRATEWAYYNLSEVSSDEIIVPTRGQDWFDNGRWLELHRQSWAANTPAGLEDIGAAWSDAFTGIARANLVIAALDNLDVANEATILAELRLLRAFFYYQLLDLFGGVPIVTDTKIEARPRAPRAELFDFIESELLAARNDLPPSWPASSHGRMTRGAADAILANMYLNAGVFTKDDGIDPTGYNSCSTVQIRGASACQRAVDFADSIINSGVYSLAADFSSNFSATNASSPENILVVKHVNQDGFGLNFVMRALHYNQLTPAPWNGFATIAETYNAFDPDDQRRRVFLVGQQYNLDALARGDTVPVTDRTGAPLVFTVTINNETAATEGEGARPYKFPVDPDHVAQENGNDFVYFRLAEIHLIKAEALNEMGAPNATALTLVNNLRARVFNPDEPVACTDLASCRTMILNERLFELAFEAKRRQDLIRHGKFTQPWSFKPAGPARNVLMPIPQSQLDANP
ncbi:MAG TPA: RagB/SusD family nutrient uptake outer membrane protein, partial [Gemmatimonadales bacterium]|nr:RagB/SusD family nutrient uptake outer membrane protein [Gemmatimonadales bacterium]